MKNKNEKNYFIQTYDNEWAGPAQALRDKLNFELVPLHGKVYPNFPTKKLLVEKELHNSWNCKRQVLSSKKWKLFSSTFWQIKSSTFWYSTHGIIRGIFY